MNEIVRPLVSSAIKASPAPSIPLHPRPAHRPLPQPGTPKTPGGAIEEPFNVGTVLDAECVIYRLEEAGQTLLAIPSTGYSPRLRSGSLDFVREAVESYGWTNGRIRPAIPSASRITRMDEALAWIPLIPQEKVVLRRIVGCRALVRPVTERHLFSWRRLATVVGADHKAVQRWHAQGIDLIVSLLARG